LRICALHAPVTSLPLSSCGTPDDGDDGEHVIGK
jgi:hypothetical protein